jgi:hypothetical protein
MSRLLRLIAAVAVLGLFSACEDIPGFSMMELARDTGVMAADHVAAAPSRERGRAEDRSIPPGTYAYPEIGNVFYPICGLVDASNR